MPPSTHAHHRHRAHDHRHGHDHGVGKTRFDRAFAVGIALNLVFVILEAGFGWAIDSLALLADAFHNLGDVAGLALAWVAVLAARRQPDMRHTYGWKRAGILAAFVNSLLLLTAMVWLAWEAVQRLHTPTPTDGVVVMAVAAVGIVVNGVTAWWFAAGRRDDLNVRGAYLHMAADALVSAGVVLGGAVTVFLGWARVDPAITMVIALVVLASAWGLFRGSVHLLFDGVPEPVDAKLVHDFLSALPGVSDVKDLHIWAMGSSETALTAHLVVPGGAPGDAFLQAATDGLAARFGIGHVTLQTVTTPFGPGCANAAATVTPAAHAATDTGRA